MRPSRPRADSMRFRSRRSSRLKVNAQHRGYMPFAESKIVSSSIQKATKPNLSESLMVMHEVDPGDPARRDDPLAGPNQWPAIPGFRDAITAYELALQATCATARRRVRVSARVPRSARLLGHSSTRRRSSGCCTIPAGSDGP